jgi:predicted transcriptional regulator YdeE
MNAQPEIVTLEPFSVMGISIRTKTRNEIGSDEPQIPSLWERFFKDILPLTPAATDPTTPLYGVYDQYESDQNGAYSVTAGTQAPSAEDVPESFSVSSIPAGEYLVFEGTGVMPDVVVSAWQAVWNYFETTETFKRRFDTDFEKYTSDDHVLIHVGVERLGD